MVELCLSMIAICAAGIVANLHNIYGALVEIRDAIKAKP